MASKYDATSNEAKMAANYVAATLDDSDIIEKWRIVVTDRAVTAQNTFKVHGTGGSYKGSVTFSVFFSRRESHKEFKIKFYGRKSQNLAAYYCAKDYLKDIVGDCLKDFKF